MKIIAAQTSDHFAAIGALLREYAEAMAYQTCFAALEQEIAGLPGAYAPPDGALLLAEVDGEPAGCIGLVKADDTRPPESCSSLASGEDPSTTAEMVRLWVRPQFRGQGIGLALVRALLARARELGYRRVELETLPERMEKAVALYRSLGFVEQTTVVARDGENRVLCMAMNL